MEEDELKKMTGQVATTGPAFFGSESSTWLERLARGALPA
jgi:hypothetical protein